MNLTIRQSQRANKKFFTQSLSEGRGGGEMCLAVDRRAQLNLRIQSCSCYGCVLLVSSAAAAAAAAVVDDLVCFQIQTGI